jgi:hypothetical protein
LLRADRSSNNKQQKQQQQQQSGVFVEPSGFSVRVRLSSSSNMFGDEVQEVSTLSQQHAVSALREQINLDRFTGMCPVGFFVDGTTDRLDEDVTFEATGVHHDALLYVSKVWPKDESLFMTDDDDEGDEEVS